MRYTVVGPFRACNVRLDSSNSVSGLPSLPGVMGCADVIRRTVSGIASSDGADPVECDPTDLRVMVILHDVQVQPGRFKPAPDRKGGPTEVPETIEGTVEATMVIEGLDVSGSRASQILASKRFCGGNVVLLPSAKRARDGDDLS